MCDAVLAPLATDSHALGWAVTRLLIGNHCGQIMGLRMAKKTRQRFVSRVTRLYEQGSISEVIEGYVRRWRRWVTSGLGVWATRRWVFDYAFSERSRTGLEIERRLRRRRKRVKREKGYFLARLLR